MMQLIPENFDGVVVFTATHVCPYSESDCQLCSDYAVGIHNWMLSHELKYVILDFQDEKEVCHELLVELVQLRKRLKIPFYFSGIMAKPRLILEKFAFQSGLPVFTTPEEAVAELRKTSSNLLTIDLAKVAFGQPISVSKPRQGLRPGVVAEGADAEAEGDGDGAESEMDDQ